MGRTIGGDGRSWVSAAGQILRRWRVVRGKSQLTLALDACVSPRHVSFIETGRASPSRDMLVALSEALDIPLDERNALLQAAGFAALYHETPLEAPAMAQVRQAIDAILRAHAHHPALLVNGRYDILDANAAGRVLGGGFGQTAEGRHGPPNLLRLLLSPLCLRPAIANWNELAARLLRRVLRECQGRDDLRRDIDSLLDECVPGERASLLRTIDWTRPADVVLPLRIRLRDTQLSLFSTVTTLGAPCDVPLQDLRIEALHPADSASEITLSRLLAGCC